MVLINGVKYACERCIRGHRVTTCNHTDQPLTMIKPKGRPSTTCSHCKELRKSRNANPSGRCTCGRQEKKRLAQKVKDEASCVCAKDPDNCACHKKRNSRRKKQSESSFTVDRDGKISKNNGHSYQSLHSLASSQSIDQDISNLLASPISMNTSFSTGWDSVSVSSSNRSPTGNGSKDNKNTIGLDPLSSMKPITPMTRTKVGEVYIPLNEYVPTELTSMENDTEHINSLLMGENVSILEDVANSGSGLTFFADTSKPLSYNTMKEQRRNFADLNLVDSSANVYHKLSRPDAVRSTSFASNMSNMSGHDSSVLPNGNEFLTSLNSSDSLSSFTTAGNSHHYQDMIHHPSKGPNHFNPIQADASSNVYGLDNESVRSVEVLSITPSFMDIPESKASSINSQSSSNSNFISWKSVNSRRERSVSIHKNHRYEDGKRNLHKQSSSSMARKPIRSMVLPEEPEVGTNSAAMLQNHSPSDSVNTLLSGNTQNGDPINLNALTTSPQPFLDSSLAPDFHHALKQSNLLNQTYIDNNSLFSATSEGNNHSPPDALPVDFADIDDLMTNL